MNSILTASKLSFFKVDKYNYNNTYICDFSNIPRPHYCMGLILEGKGIFTFDKNEVTVAKGDIIFVPVGSTYISTWIGSPDVTYISVHFSFDFPGPFSQSSKLKIQKITLPEFENVKKCCINMLEDFEKEKPIQLSVLGEFFSILGKVYSQLQFIPRKQLDERIKKAVEYIEYHYREDFSVDSLSKLCNMSTSHFYSCFKSSTGLSPIEYKHKICIRHAELMLLDDTKKSIEEISAALGFNSAIYFRKIFKKITGKSPREYRKIGIE